MFHRSSDSCRIKNCCCLWQFLQVIRLYNLLPCFSSCWHGGSWWPADIFCRWDVLVVAGRVFIACHIFCCYSAVIITFLINIADAHCFIIGKVMANVVNMGGVQLGIINRKIIVILNVYYPWCCPYLSGLICLWIGWELVFMTRHFAGTMSRCQISIHQLAGTSYLMPTLPV